jgi:hypothetical protein
MKKYLAILLAAGLLLACKAGNDKEKSSAAEPAGENHSEHAEKVSGLNLNNGAKWKADSTTLWNAGNLHAIITKAKQESPGNYLQTATQLQEGLNKMVKECKMQGPDHDALHQWLMPLLEKTKELQKAATAGEAGKILTEIEKQVNLFPQYFE